MIEKTDTAILPALFNTGLASKLGPHTALVYMCVMASAIEYLDEVDCPKPGDKWLAQDLSRACIKRLAGVSLPTITVAVTELEREGLVRRAPHSGRANDFEVGVYTEHGWESFLADKAKPF